MCSVEQGKRLFPIIGGGSSLGAVVGARLAKLLVPYGPSVLMGSAVVILIGCAFMIAWAGQRPLATTGKSEALDEQPLSKEGAFQLLFHDKYLLLIAGMVVFLNWVNSSGEYLLDRTLLVAANEFAAQGGRADVYVGAFKADYFGWYNLIGVLLQLFAVSRILKLVGVKNALFFMPCFALVAYGSAVFLPVLGVMRLVKIGENSLQYSLQDTTRHALFLITSRAEKFVGKTAVDTVAVRLGSIMSASMVYVGTRLGWSTSTFATINVLAALAWLGFVVAIGKEHARRSNEAAPPAVAEPARA
jgi:AAA family ATP:ADP antiporter